MSRYRDYDKWLNEQTELYVQPVGEEEKEEFLNWDQLKVRDYSPGSFSSGGLVVRGTPPTKEVDPNLPALGPAKTSWVDSNPLFDFVGNVLWGFGESFVAPTVADIASEGELSASFGHQAWKDESWAGRIGYMLGTAGGMLTGIGLVGKGISSVSRVFGAGTKLATKKGLGKIASHGLEDASESKLKSIVVKTRNTLQKGKASEIKKLNWSTRLNPLATARASINHNPLGNQVIRNQVTEEVTESIAKITRLSPDSPVLNDIVETIMKASSESLNKHLGHSLAYTLTMRLGVNAKVAKVAGDVFYEALLLGAWDSMIGYVGDSKAREYGLVEGEQWNYETFFHRATHGMLVGSILAPIRYLPGGKEVSFGKSGMIADLSSIAKVIRNRFRNPDTMRHAELLGFANSFTISSSGKIADDVFLGVKGYSEAWLKNLKPTQLKAADVDILKNMFRTVKAEMPHIVGTLTKEIWKDGINSFSRASIGSFAMNFTAYKDVIDSGIWNTEDYPLSKFLADHWVGMVYMKRGKSFGDYKAKPKKFGDGIFKDREILETAKVNLAGRTPVKRYYSESGFEMNGTEISRMLDAMNVLNKSKHELDIYNTVAHLNTAAALDALKAQNLNTTVDAKAVIDLVRRRFTDPIENQKRVDADYAENVLDKKGEALLQSWEFHTKMELNRLNDLFIDLQKKGKKEQAQQVRKEADELMETINIVQNVQEYAVRGYDGKVMASMTLAESLDFVREFQNLKLPNTGQKLTWENFSIFEEEVMKSDMKIEADVANLITEYVAKSLNHLGMADKNSVIEGKLHVHKDVFDGLAMLKTFVDPSNNSRPYKDSAITLENALLKGKYTGIFKIGDRGIKLDADQFIQKAKLKDFVSEYKISTENAHELTFNSGPGRENSWRDKITGWDKKPGFLDYKILGQDPFWNSMQSAHRYRRNEQAYYSFIGGMHNESSKKLYDYLQDKLGGEVNFRIVEEVLDRNFEMKDHLFTSGERELAIFFNQLNNMLEITNLKGSGAASKQSITVEQLVGIKEEINKHIGNVITSPEEFSSFKKLVYKKFINDLTGNAMISNGIKIALTDLMNTNDNLLSMKHGGTLNIRSSEGLKKTILGDPNLSPHSQEYKKLEELITDYIKEFENPILQATKDKGNSVNFIDDKLAIAIDDAFTRSDLIQHVRRTVNTSRQIGSTDLHRIMNNLNSLSIANKEFDLNIARLNEQAVSKGDRPNVELVNAYDQLRRESVDLGRLVNILIETKDAVGLRSFIDNAGRFEDLTYRMLASNGINSKRIQEFTLTLQDYVKKSLEERSLILRVDTIQDVNDYIAEAVKNISHTDFSGRPKTSDVTLSAQQYSKKWFLSEEYVNDLIHGPRKLLDAAGIVSPPLHTNLNRILNDGLMGSVLGRFSVKDYVDIVVDPLINAKKIKIELNEQLSKNNPLRKDYGTFEEYYTDTYHIIQSALGSKKVAMGVYENGVLRVERTSISTWNTGVNRLASFLGLDIDVGEIMLLGNRYGTGRGFSTKMNKETRAQLEADLADGRPTDLSVLELLRDSDRKMFDTYSNLIVGDGRDATTKYVMVQLDEKQAVLIPKFSKEKIVQTYSDPTSTLRQYLATIIASSTTSQSGGKVRLTRAEIETRVQDFIKQYVPNAKFDKTTGIMDKLVLTNQQAKDLVMIGRLASSMQFDLMKVLNGQATIKEALSSLKYIKLDSAKSGTAMTKLNLEFARDYFPRFMGPRDNVRKAYEIFLDQTFDAKGRIKERRDLNIFDEGVKDAEKYFDSREIGRVQYKKQLKRNNPEISEKELNELIEIELMQSHYDRLPASVVNGHKWLSLPAMVQTLMARGARSNWFIWEKGEIVGFNVAVKPVEFHSMVNPKTGSMEVHIGKTAYTWNPVVDKYMQKTVYKDGKYQQGYYIDAIGFSSTHKQHTKYNPTSGLVENPGINLSARERSQNFISDMPINRVSAESQIFKIPLESILIKSISGKKDATISAGFGNLMSNKALGELNSVTKVADVYNDMYSRFADMAVNPFSYQVITQKLLFGQKRTGDMIGEVTGIEQILKVDGLPIFEFMMPNIDKMVVSEYMGTRNSITSSMKTGSYGVMIPGEGYSFPVRREGVQYQFGGSGMSSKEWQQPLTDIVSLSNVNGQAAFKVKGNEAFTFIYKMNKEFLIEHGLNVDRYGKDFIGSDFAIVMDQGKPVIVGPHLAAKWGEKNKKDFEKLNKAIEKDFKELAGFVTYDKSLTTIGDLALFLNGTREEFTTSYKDYNLFSHANEKNTHNDMAAYNLFMGTQAAAKNKPLYSQIHLGKVDLRQPKPGLNDWVISRVERLLDERKGPGTEMNALDTIDPQDADFDIDKSASMYGLPGSVVKEIYQVSGYAQVTSEVFEQAKLDVGLIQGVAKHKDALALIDAHKAPLMRQTSILSTILQYMSERPEIGKDLFQPGWSKESGKESQSRFDLGPKAGYTTKDGFRYEFKIRDNYKLVGSLGYMKSIIKAVVDMYKTPQNVGKKDLPKLIWEDSKHGFIEIVEYKPNDKKGRNVSYSEMTQGGRHLFNKIRRGILEPLGELHNLNLMTEHFGDGTSRKMGSFELVHKFEQIIYDIKNTGYDWVPSKVDPNIKKYKANDLAVLTEPLSRFLGYENKRNTINPSNLPLIKGITALRQAQNKVFGQLPSLDSGLGQLLVTKSKSVDSRLVNRAIDEIIFDQKKSAQITVANYKYEQINDIYNELVYKGKSNSKVGKYWGRELDKYEKIIANYNAKINDPQVIYEQNRTQIQKRPGKGELSKIDHVAIYREKDGEVKLFDIVDPGKEVYWKKGDLLWFNPKRIVAGDKFTQGTRAAMHDAFARKDARLSETDYQYLAREKSAFGAELASDKYQLIDPTRPRDSQRWKINNEKELGILMDFLERAYQFNPAQGPIMQQQFLHILLAPRVDKTIFSMNGIDNTTGKVIKHFHFHSNKYYEKLVFNFLDKAQKGNAGATLDINSAKDMYKLINDRFKAAYIKQYDPLLKGDYFDFGRLERDWSDFSLLPPVKNLPQFMFQKDINRQAQSIGKAYITASYYLNPVDLYRLSVGMTGTLQQLPSATSISQAIERLWEGTDLKSYQGGNITEPKHSFRNQIYHSTETETKSSLRALFENLEAKCFN